MKCQSINSKRIDTSKTEPKVLLATFFRLPVLNTFGCNMEIKGAACKGMHSSLPNKSGACAPVTHQACLAGSGPQSGLTHLLAATHREVFEAKNFSQSICYRRAP
jgi:hypothetical protein